MKLLLYRTCSPQWILRAILSSGNRTAGAWSSPHGSI